MVSSENNRKSPARRGIGRAEVVVLVFVALLLAGIVLPLVVQTRSKSRHEQFVDRLRDVGVKIRVYHDTFESFPPGVQPPPRDKPKLPPGVDSRGR
jgi:hypothetical protein